jgi:hypothetical protein
LGHSQVQVASSLEVKRPDHEADTNIKYTWNYASTFPYVFMTWCLIKDRDTFFNIFPNS